MTTSSELIDSRGSCVRNIHWRDGYDTSLRLDAAPCTRSIRQDDQPTEQVTRSLRDVCGATRADGVCVADGRIPDDARRVLAVRRRYAEASTAETL